MAKRTLWQWLFGLMAKPEQDRQPMAVPNQPGKIEAEGPLGVRIEGIHIIEVRDCFTDGFRHGKPMAGTVSLTEDEWNERCNQHRGASDVELCDMAHRLAGGEPQRDVSAKWEPGIEHSRPHPVKENPDGTIYYKGKVYRMIGDHGRRNNRRR